MAAPKKNEYLKKNPSESFSMRFGKKHGKKLVEAISKKAEDEDRSFPGAIERALVEYFGIK